MVEKDLIGKTLTGINQTGDELELEFDNEFVIRITGGYCREVYTELLRKKVVYERI
jgi:hypothetical protein